MTTSTDMTSEEKHKICKQPDPTCKTVDEVLGTLKRAIGYAEDGKRAHEVEEIQQLCNEAAYYIDAAMSELEDVRRVNQELRQWGQEWKDMAKGLYSEDEIESHSPEMLGLLRRIATKGAFMDLDGLRITVSDFLHRRHLEKPNSQDDGA